MILKKLYIHNYKSFYDTTIELGKFNIILGENNSGKSNIIDVLEFINLAHNEGFDKAILEKGGFEKVLNYNSTEKKVVIEFEVEDNDFLVKERFTFNQTINIISTINYGKLEDKLLFLGLIGIRKIIF